MKRPVLLLLLTFCFAAFAQSLFAQATLSVQGVLKNSDGTAVDNGKYTLNFKLYNSATGGTALWSEIQNNVQVTGGIYSVLLGSTTPLTAAFNETYYIGVGVDGGAEMVPRARLTSSPYALALLGTGNLFPSSGAVGAGTVSPAAGYQIHALNATGQADVLVQGPGGAKITFDKINATSGMIGYLSGNNDLVINTNGNTSMQAAGAQKLLISNDGVRIPVLYNDGGSVSVKVGTTERILAHGGGASIFGDANTTGKFAVGQSTVDGANAFKVTGDSYLAGYVEINGTKIINTGGGTANFNVSYSSGSIGYASAGIQTGFGLKVNGSILTTGAFAAISDRRVKKDFRIANNVEDLNLLRKIRINDYRYIDNINKGNAYSKGVVAQELAEVMPEAIAKTADFIPDAYAMCEKVHLSNGLLSLSLDKKYEVSIGDEVKIILPEGEKTVKVVAIVNENTFSIDWQPDIAPEKIFVYGKKVRDFHTVDYNRIFTLNVSATQELAREVEALKKENTALKSALDKKEGEVKSMDARLRVLENKLAN